MEKSLPQMDILGISAIPEIVSQLENGKISMMW